MSKKKVVVILGMHRSGTSVFSNWLSKCGLNLGDRLLGANKTNPSGHFEDLDFLEFHESILKRNQLGYDVISDEHIKINKYDKAKAESIINFKSQLYSQWGWKEPRTCLFLDLWYWLIPNGYYIILHRNAEEILNSLIKRDKKLVKQSKNPLKNFKLHQKFNSNLPELQNHYIKVIQHYNQQLIDFAQSIPSEKRIILNVNHLRSSDEQLFKHLNEKWGLNLKYCSINEVFDNSLFDQFIEFPKGILPELREQIKITDKKLENLYSAL